MTDALFSKEEILVPFSSKTRVMLGSSKNGSMYGTFTYIYHKNQPSMWENLPYMDPTVGGRNPSPVDMVNIPLLTGFQHVRWLAGFLPSTVWLWVGIYGSHPQELIPQWSTARCHERFERPIVGPGVLRHLRLSIFGRTTRTLIYSFFFFLGGWICWKVGCCFLPAKVIKSFEDYSFLLFKEPEANLSWVMVPFQDASDHKEDFPPFLGEREMST